jgi:hypothetical protein
MSWTDAQLGLLHLSEERVGKAVRSLADLEDAQFEKATKALRS